MRCPKHKIGLVPSDTFYGIRFSCPINDCTVVCWSNKNSTPADARTRSARSRAHAEFDLIWKNEHISRNKAYSMLASYMGLTRGRAHIGYFNRKQCKLVLKFIKSFYKENRLKSK